MDPCPPFGNHNGSDGQFGWLCDPGSGACDRGTVRRSLAMVYPPVAAAPAETDRPEGLCRGVHDIAVRASRGRETCRSIYAIFFGGALPSNWQPTTGSRERRI